MALASISFRFSQKFNFPVAAVYRWATDYQPDDIPRLGLQGHRKIKHLCNETLLLSDTYYRPGGRRISKKKLVRLYPERFCWTNTTLAGPGRHSQFFYQLVRLGRNCSRLDFTGKQIFKVARPTPAKLRALARALRQEDSWAWKNLARSLQADLSKRKR